MGKLDKFVGKSVSKGTSTSVTTTGSQLPSWAQSNQTTPSSAAQTILQGSAARFAIALDATGSMGPLIEMAKKSIGRILQRVISRAGRPVEIKIIVYRDYDVPNELVATSETTKDAQSLIAWLGKVHVSGGGANEGEAVESALEAIMQAGKFDAVLLAGDEPSNDRQQIRAGCGKNSPSAADLAGLFAQTGTPHPYVCRRKPPLHHQGFRHVGQNLRRQVGTSRWQQRDDRYGRDGDAGKAQGIFRRARVHERLSADVEGG